MDKESLEYLRKRSPYFYQLELKGERMNEEIKVWDFLPEFMEAFEAQLRADDIRWGDTWLNRSPQDQESRLFGDVKDYYDKFFHGSEPMPYLKVIGNAFICWIREEHPELFEGREF